MQGILAVKTYNNMFAYYQVGGKANKVLRQTIFFYLIKDSQYERLEIL